MSEAKYLYKVFKCELGFFAMLKMTIYRIFCIFMANATSFRTFY